MGWSATAAARWAREARIATVKHQRTSALASDWNLSRTMRAMQVQQEVNGSRLGALAVMLGGMGYRPPYDPDLRAMNAMTLADEAAQLAEAQLYVMSPSMCDIVVAAAKTLTLEDLQLLVEDDLPSPNGLVVLPAPLITRAVSDELGDLRAISWSWPRPIILPPISATAADLVVQPGRKAAPVRCKEIPAVRISTYNDAYGPVQPDSFVQFAETARVQGQALPPFILDGIRCVPFRAGGRTAEQNSVGLDALREAALRVAGQVKDLSERVGRPEDSSDAEQVMVGEYTPGAEIDDSDDLFAVKFLYAFWRLCEQQLTEVEQAAANHSAQVAAARTKTAVDARVVQLRNRSTTRSEDGRVVDWQHRWVVRMHKVRQWYPSEQRHKILMRGPFVKGPADKPLLGGETVRALLR